jgi:hypothetical protein
MRHLNLILMVGCVAAVCHPAGAFAQGDKYEKPADLRPLVPPVFPLPQRSQINPGTVSGTRGLERNVPFQSPDVSPSPPPPGFRLSIPTRRAE